MPAVHRRCRTVRRFPEVGRCEGIEFKFPEPKEGIGIAQSLDAVIDLSGVRARRVNLANLERWWSVAGGSMLAFRADDGRPVALVPGGFGGFRALDPVSAEGPRSALLMPRR